MNHLGKPFSQAPPELDGNRMIFAIEERDFLLRTWSQIALTAIPAAIAGNAWDSPLLNEFPHHPIDFGIAFGATALVGLLMDFEREEFIFENELGSFHFKNSKGQWTAFDWVDICQIRYARYLARLSLDLFSQSGFLIELSDGRKFLLACKMNGLIDLLGRLMQNTSYEIWTPEAVKEYEKIETAISIETDSEVDEREAA
ncbi:MAG: hypothetical protein SFT81_01980 [Candidatus Caenarcaniphilales bacterium]|nr:hypothetical protein [Candidatus Caenarcaniphilales bacterium]